MESLLSVSWCGMGLSLLLGIGSPVSVLGWQVYTWLKEGYWPLLPVTSLLTEMGIIPSMPSWLGLQRIYLALLDMPLSFALFAVGMVVGGLFCWMSSAAGKQVRAARRAQKADH
jgi:hypothetical protein